MIRVIGSGILTQSGKDYMKTPEAARQLEAMKKLMDKVRMKKPTKQQILDETDEQKLSVEMPVELLQRIDVALGEYHSLLDDCAWIPLKVEEAEKVEIDSLRKALSEIE